MNDVVQRYESDVPMTQMSFCIEEAFEIEKYLSFLYHIVR